SSHCQSALSVLSVFFAMEPILTTLPITSLAWAPNGRLLAVGTRSGDVLVVDLTSHWMSAQKAGSGPVTGLAWNPNSRLLAIACSRSIQILDNLTGRFERRFPGETVAWSPSGQKLATGEGATVQIRDAETGELERILEGQSN